VGAGFAPGSAGGTVVADREDPALLAEAFLRSLPGEMLSGESEGGRMETRGQVEEAAGWETSGACTAWELRARDSHSKRVSDSEQSEAEADGIPVDCGDGSVSLQTFLSRCQGRLMGSRSPDKSALLAVAPPTTPPGTPPNPGRVEHCSGPVIKVCVH
jgi:hypothetical protein